MKIKNLFSGIVTNERADIARALIRQGMAEALEPDTEKPPRQVAPNVTVAGDGTVHAEHGDSYRLPKSSDALPAAQPQFAVVVASQFKSTRSHLAIRMTLPTLVADYIGRPENANKRVTWEGGGRWLNGFGREVPAEIVKEYARCCKESPDLRPFLEQGESYPE